MAKGKSKAPLASKILYAVAAAFLALAIVATGACNYFSGVLDTYIGVGERVVTIKAGAENWDSARCAADYGYARQSNQRHYRVLQQRAPHGDL